MTYFEVRSATKDVRSDLQKIRKNDFLLVQQTRQADPVAMSEYSFFVQGKECSFVDFIKAADQVAGEYAAASKEKYAYLPVSSGVSGINKKMVKVRRERLAHTDSENCRCLDCYTAKLKKLRIEKEIAAISPSRINRA